MDQKLPFDSHHQAIRILALGDSYTIGEAVSPDGAWPAQLVDRLEAIGFQVSESFVLARTGWTTADLIKALADNPPQPPYDLVFLLIGVNNQYQGLRIEEYQDQVKYLLAKSVMYAGEHPQRVIVLSIPDWGAAPFARNRDQALISHEINAYNRINLKAAQNLGCFYEDITPLSRQVIMDERLVAEDGLHPSKKMYSNWVDQILPKAIQILTGALD